MFKRNLFLFVLFFIMILQKNGYSFKSDPQDIEFFMTAWKDATEMEKLYEKFYIEVCSRGMDNIKTHGFFGAYFEKEAWEYAKRAGKAELGEEFDFDCPTKSLIIPRIYPNGIKSIYKILGGRVSEVTIFHPSGCRIVIVYNRDSFFRVPQVEYIYSPREESYIKYMYQAVEGKDGKLLESMKVVDVRLPYVEAKLNESLNRIKKPKEYSQSSTREEVVRNKIIKLVDEYISWKIEQTRKIIPITSPEYIPHINEALNLVLGDYEEFVNFVIHKIMNK